MHLKNQSDLFLSLDPLIEKINKERLQSTDHDTRVILNTIVFNEVLDLIINKPESLLTDIHQCVFGMFGLLRQPEVIRMVKELKPGYKLPYTVSLKNTQVTFHIKDIDFYLLNSYGETVEMREKRIDNFLMDFVQEYPLCHHITDGTAKQAEDLFYGILRKICDQNYFLTNSDLNRLIDWLIDSYNEEKNIFSSNALERGKVFTVALLTRHVKVKGLSTDISKNEIH